MLNVDLMSEGYDVTVATTGPEAIRLATSNDYALILLDVMLPGKDGFEVCREMRRAGRETPIILLTARTHDAEKVMGLELGADDYITKPFNPRELRARIKAVLRRTSADDTGRRLVWRRRGGLRPRRGASRRPGNRRERARVQADDGIRPRAGPPADTRATARHGLGPGHRHQRSVI